MGVIIDTLKDALSVIQDEDRRRKATEALERVEELYYDGRTTVTNEDAFFMALGVVLYYAVPVWPRDVGNLARALGVDLERIGWYL
ncbi:MAG: hypothetical protein RXO24_09440 [Acidilobus sp.]